MSKEEKLIADLTQKFPFLGESCVIVRDRRLIVTVDRDKALEVFRYLNQEQKFDFCCTITGLDSGDNFEVIYHIANVDGMVCNVKVFAPKSDPVFKSTLEVYPGSIFYERELEDMFGIKIDTLPEGRHYPLPDDWPQGEYPLRKDWKPKNDNQPIVEEE